MGLVRVKCTNCLGCLACPTLCQKQHWRRETQQRARNAIAGNVQHTLDLLLAPLAFAEYRRRPRGRHRGSGRKHRAHNGELARGGLRNTIRNPLRALARDLLLRRYGKTFVPGCSRSDLATRTDSLQLYGNNHRKRPRPRQPRQHTPLDRENWAKHRCTNLPHTWRPTGLRSKRPETHP